MKIKLERSIEFAYSMKDILKKISVIIVAYKCGNVLLNCLNSIYDYNDLGNDLEVIIVDNSPVNERIEFDILKSRYKNYKYIVADNRGFGAGNNIGARIARGEILAFFNPDIILIEPIFERIYNLFKYKKRLKLMGVQLVDENYKNRNSIIVNENLNFIGGKIFKILQSFNCFSSRYMTILGADMFIKKSDFFSIGCFDENFFMYFEENDLRNRLKDKFPNGIIYLDKKVNMIHLESKGSELQCNKRALIFKNSLMYYCKKYNLNYKKVFNFLMSIYY